MTLYSSTLNFVGGANVLFINNSAQDTGGAIHVEPDLTRMPTLECFYQCNNTHATLYFMSNSAESGGDNVYGTSLVDCEYTWHQNCLRNATILNTRKSSVSSDPIHICICDNEGQPQCRNSSFTNMSKNVYPSEKFTLPVAIVGADYGVTIGIVYANLLISGKPSRAVLTVAEKGHSKLPISQFTFQNWSFPNSLF